jgi:hypothetical protein
MEMNPTDGDFAATRKSFMAPPRFGTSDVAGTVTYLAGAEAVSLPAPTFQRLTATERNA